ncbi:MAG: hypothetical protein ACRD2O_14195 [Terriglobia bacterium]
MQWTRIGTELDGKQVIDGQFQGRFYRDRGGNTRADYFDPSVPGDSIAVSFLWSPENTTMTLVSFADRTVKGVHGPAYPSEHQWTPAGPFRLEFTNDRKTIHGLECTRVSLLPLQNRPAENLQGETWIAADWGLVMLDVAETPDVERRWEVLQIDRIEPDPSVFQVPEGFATRQ